jgi:hypothetical protein
LAPIFQEFAKTRRCRVVESDTEYGAMIRTEALREPRTAAETADFRSDELR